MTFLLHLCIRTLGSFIAILAFAMYNKAPKEDWITCGVVGAIGGLIYLIVLGSGQSETVSCFASALMITIVSNIFSQKFRKPETLYLIPGILPNVPGAGMYRAVRYLIQRNQEASIANFMLTLQIAGAIAFAIFFVDSIFTVLRNRHSH